jgi:Fur family ferric uptake transcriptional regulator
MAETDAETLTEAGLRLTPQRQAVAQTLRRMGKEVSVQELYDRVRRRHPYLGRATVFRAIDRLVEAGLARRLERPGHVSAYVWCEPTHHHHLICTECRTVQELDEQAVAPLADRIARREGFRVDHARLDFYGRCRNCERKT